MANVRRKRRFARKVVKRTTAQVGRVVKKVLAKTAEPRYLLYGINQIAVGISSGAAGTGSYALNQYLMNGGANIALGTALNQRTGNKIRVESIDLDIVIILAAGVGCKMLVVKEAGANTLMQDTTNTALTTHLENAAFSMEPVTNGGVPSGYFYVPAGEKDTVGYQLIKDHKFYAQEPAGSNTYFPVRMRIPLNMTQTYNSAGTPLGGDWGIYFVSSSATAANCTITGSIRMNFRDY